MPHPRAFERRALRISQAARHTTNEEDCMKLSKHAVSILACMLAASGAAAQTYPTHPVKIIVPFAAGGPADIYARFLGQRLQESLGQSFVVEDRPGGGSVVGTDAAAHAAPDGYTILMMSNTHTVNESLLPNKPYKLLREFAPIAPVNYSDLVMVVHPSVPAKTLKEFIALAKSKPHALNYASSGPGTPYHMAGELFKAMAGVDIVHVPYKGSSGARTDLMGGQVQMMFDAITTMAPVAQSGRVRALATTGRARSAVTPDLPTVSEAGVPGYEAVIWIGLMAPVATPAPIVEKLNAEVNRIVNQPEVKSAWSKQGAVAMSMSTDEFGKFLRDDIAKWANVVKISGAKVD
jgi:tripartite-type tricarboxylate transporter receptor subunit TctC